MNVPKQPVLAAIFLANLLMAFLGFGLAQKLSKEPEWTGIVIALILLAFGFSADRVGKNKERIYPPDLLVVLICLRTLSTVLFWSGLYLSASVAPARNTTYVLGMIISAVGVLVSIGQMIRFRPRN